MKKSPLHNQNIGYESDSQEKSNLMTDNPIAKDASSGRPMILKHMSGVSSSPVKMYDEEQ